MPTANSLNRFWSAGRQLLAVSTALMVTIATVVLSSGRISTAGPPDEAKAPGFTIPPAPVPIPNLPVLSPLDAQVDDFVKITLMKAQAKVSGKGLAVAVVDSG